MFSGCATTNEQPKPTEKQVPLKQEQLISNKGNSSCNSYSNECQNRVDKIDCPLCDDKAEIKFVQKEVSECPLKHKTVVYKGICHDCEDFPVTVRENSCCIDGGCK